ncbi:MAG: AMP-binding protein [Actinomycetota bacterium]
MTAEYLADGTGLRRVRNVHPFPVGPSSVADLWDRRTPTSVALVDGDIEWTTAELRAECERVARCLIDMGARNERVVWILDNDAQPLISLIGTVLAGGMWVGVNTRTTESERRSIITDAEAQIVLSALPEDDPDVRLGLSPAATHGAALAYTSGTTGRPKAVVHMHQQLLYPAAAAIATEALGPSSRIATPLALSTLNILLLGPLTALACGGTAVIMGPEGPTAFVRSVQQHQVTRALVVPTIVHDLVERGTEPAELTPLERMIMGGAGFDRARATAAQQQLGISLVASYGLSEAPTGVARMAIGDAGAQPLPGVDIAIEPDGEITLAPSTSGPWANTWQGTLGYRNQPDETARLWRGGRLHTGDAGTIDGDGLLRVTGRMSDMINRGGATIAPAEVEAALLELDGVDDVAVFGVDDDRLGQDIAAAIIGTADPDEVAVAARRTISGYKVPRRWLTLDALPRNANGKVDRNELRRLLG